MHKAKAKAKSKHKMDQENKYSPSLISKHKMDQENKYNPSLKAKLDGWETQNQRQSQKQYGRGVAHVEGVAHFKSFAFLTCATPSSFWLALVHPFTKSSLSATTTSATIASASATKLSTKEEEGGKRISTEQNVKIAPEMETENELRITTDALRDSNRALEENKEEKNRKEEKLGISKKLSDALKDSDVVLEDVSVEQMMEVKQNDAPEKYGAKNEMVNALNRNGRSNLKNATYQQEGPEIGGPPLADTLPITYSLIGVR